jgi:hypothetical protein
VGDGHPMTWHFHGGPITPRSELMTLAGRCFCVSYAAPEQIEVVHQIGQSVLLDNGAFSFWRSGKQTNWDGYYRWCDKWLQHRTTWAVIPDVIDGSETANDHLISQWLLRFDLGRGAPVWHLHESIERLDRLSRLHPRVCIGSSGAYAQIGTPQWHDRMRQAFNALIDRTVGPPRCDVHMLRGMGVVGGPYPFTSVDSTDVARNHNRPQNTAVQLAERWDAVQSPAVWRRVDQLELGDYPVPEAA